MFTGPVGPVEVFFYWPEAVLGELGQRFTARVEPCISYIILYILHRLKAAEVILVMMLSILA